MQLSSYRVNITSKDAEKYLLHAKGVLLSLGSTTKFASKTIVVDEAVIVGKRVGGVRSATVLLAIDFVWVDETTGDVCRVEIPYADILDTLSGGSPKSVSVNRSPALVHRNASSAGYGAGCVVYSGGVYKLRASYSAVVGRFPYTKWEFKGAALA